MLYNDHQYIIDAQPGLIMNIKQKMRSDFDRTDIWREGEWLDLWSVVHFLSGVSLSFGIYLFNFGTTASILIIFLLLVSYEMWEAMVRIEETPANRFMDVVVGMISFLLFFFFIIPNLSRDLFIFVSMPILAINITMSVFGWLASQKASSLKKNIHDRYEVGRAKILSRRSDARKKKNHQ